MSDEIISQDHSEFKDVPPCTHTEYNYFEKEKLVFSDIRSAKTHIKKQIIDGNKNLYIKFRTSALKVETIAQSLVQYSLSVVAQDGYRWQAQYAVNPQQNTIRLQLAMVV